MTDALDALGPEDRRRLRSARVPRSFAPMKAVLVDRAFSDPGWVFERKLDGVRCTALRDGGPVRLLSRSGKALNAAYPELVEALERERERRFVLDGEIVAFDGGATSFARLQRRMQIRDPDEARRTGVAVYLYVFDLPHLDGHDLTGLPLRARKAVLRRALAFHDPVRFSPHRNAEGERLLADACRRGWEGLIAKRADARYRTTRSDDWRKLKCHREQELVIGGFTPPQGSRTDFGALLVGYYEDGALRYAGKVGTGFDQATLRALGARLTAIERAKPPFAAGDLPRNARWTEPELVAQIAFTEWTHDGRLRHPRYIGLRDDKRPREVVRELPVAP